MTRRDWWLGLGLLVAAILVHALVPRYEWRQVGNSVVLLRLDRWTGTAEYGRWESRRWTSTPTAAETAAEINRTLKEWEAVDASPAK
jgi:hypothetical protein